MITEKDSDKFFEEKEKQLSREDKSNEGKWDQDIKPLCDLINSKDDFYTTSSCAGRIILVKGKEEKTRNAFLFKSHKKVGFENFKKRLEKASEDYKDLIYFKLDSCILHVACQNLNSAEWLLNKSKESGWKRSGIFSLKKDILLELVSTENMELPIAKNGKILLKDSYIKLLLEKSNKKIDRVREKIKRMEENIKNN